MLISSYRHISAEGKYTSAKGKSEVLKYIVHRVSATRHKRSKITQKKTKHSVKYSCRTI